jgi:hypothetical protein
MHSIWVETYGLVVKSVIGLKIYKPRKYSVRRNLQVYFLIKAEFTRGGTTPSHRVQI